MNGLVFVNQGQYHKTNFAVTQFVPATLLHQFEVLLMLPTYIEAANTAVSSGLNSLSPSNTASKNSRKLCYCKISFAILVLGNM